MRYATASPTSLTWPTICCACCACSSLGPWSAACCRRTLPRARSRSVCARSAWCGGDGAEAQFLDVADPPMRLAYLTHAYTAQRQGDVLAMTWGQYDGAVIRLRQAKTDALVEVPVHRELRAALDAAPRTAVTILTDH